MIDQNDEGMQAQADFYIQAVLTNMQKAVCFLTNQPDIEGLLSLQSCCNELFKAADTCLKHGKKMVIKEEDGNC